MNSHERSAFRAFVRENHPDRGGDPAVFVAGLARFGAVAPPGAGEARFDAPVEVVAPKPFALRVAVALLRTVRQHRARRVR